MQTLRQLGGSLLLAAFSIALVIGGISLALAESYVPVVSHTHRNTGADPLCRFAYFGANPVPTRYRNRNTAAHTNRNHPAAYFLPATRRLDCHLRATRRRPGDAFLPLSEHP